MSGLQNKTVLVTRPEHQADSLCALIENNGGNALRFPVIEIAGPTDPDRLQSIIRRLSDFDIAVFISPNAVQYGMKAIETAGGLPAGIKLAAVGMGSARSLEQCGYSVDIFPAEKFNSEALLQLAPMLEVSGKQIIIFRGEGGRELLATTLRQRGAMVEYAECYKRQKPVVTADRLRDNWLQGTLDIIIVTSNESLQNLYDITGESNRENLLKTPLVVVSERAVELARALGFGSDVIEAATASDQALFQAVELWVSQQS